VKLIAQGGAFFWTVPPTVLRKIQATNGLAMEGKMKIEMTEQTAKFALHCMILCGRTGGGSPLFSAIRELSGEIEKAQSAEMELDTVLLGQLLGNVVMELEQDDMPPEDSQELRRIVQSVSPVVFSHPYDVK
jgi:hypothetical protein